jgi:hypothetical protein
MIIKSRIKFGVSYIFINSLFLFFIKKQNKLNKYQYNFFLFKFKK